MARRYLEDFVPGAVHEAGSVRIAEAEIVEFASRYDPQAFHVDFLRAAPRTSCYSAAYN